MINEQAIDTMTEMLALISKHGKRAYAEVESDASREHRRRAWVVTCLLESLAGHAARSDQCYLLGDDTSRTNTERDIYYRTARQEDRDFMRELSEFKKHSAQFENGLGSGKSRTDNDIVLELESCLQQVEILRKLHTKFLADASIEVAEKQRALQDISRAANTERLVNVKEQLDVLAKLAHTRVMLVSLNRYRTVIKHVMKLIAKPATTAAKLKNTPSEAARNKALPPAESQDCRCEEIFLRPRSQYTFSEI